MIRFVLHAGSWALTALGLVFAGLGFVYAWVLPEVYEASARLRVPSPPASAAQPAVPARGAPWPPEFERFYSKVVLYPVITNLNLRHKWSARLKHPEALEFDLTYRMLKERIEVLQPRGTSLIEIRAASEDRQEAAELANAIAKAYLMTGAEPAPAGQAAGVPSRGEIIDLAGVPLRPSRPTVAVKISLLGLGVILGGLGVAALAALRRCEI